MNRPIRRVAVAALLLFGLLFANVNYLQVVRAQSLRHNRRNTRLLLDEYARPRGDIVAGKSTLVESRPTKDRLKYLRVYGNGNAGIAKAFAPVTGYYSFVFGATGIERVYNDTLSGNDDRLFVRRLSDLLNGRTPVGGSVLLTIDPELQILAAHELGNRRGAVVALDPRTGAVLALVTSPSYDPHVLSSHNGKAIRTAFARLTADPALPLHDRAAEDTYPPGSTFKMVTAATALEHGLTPDTLVDCPHTLPLPLTRNVQIHNFAGESCDAAKVPLLRAFQESYNTAFGALGLRLGGEAIQAQAERFGFNAKPDLELRTVESVFPQGLNAPQSAQSAIGQYDVRATPLQMAMVAAAIANGGRLMRPYLVSEVEAPDLSVLDRTTPRVIGQAVSPATAAALTRMMVAVVQGGTGIRAQIPGVTVAGKTGTAQNRNPRPHTWFVGFAPAEAPRIAIAVLVENGGTEDNPTGGRVAAPIAKAVISAYLGHL